jgi:serine/threonine-protein kinase HipA
MTSENECFVYIVLPGETEPVTAGRLVIAKTNTGDSVGRFVYGRSYLSRPNAVPVDPVGLTLSDRIFETGLMGGLFGALRDASPDLWGRMLIERHLKRTDVSEMEYLLYSPDDRIGALGFGLNQNPPAPLRDFNKSFDLEKLQRAVDEITDTGALDSGTMDQTEKLLLIGTSMGGARPKAVVYDNGALWVAKFAHPSDRYDMALSEHAMLRLAQDCGLNAAESKTVKVGGRNTLLVKRFDRDKAENGFLRHRMISALTVLRTDDNPLRREKWSYILIAEELRRFSAEPVKDARELYRRMIFNALITNNDDHPRNLAFVAQGSWRLAPAYDLTPIPMVAADHRDLAMICGSHGRFANINNLISECRRFMFEPDEAKDLVMDMAGRISNNWYKTARQAGMTERDCDAIRPAFVYPGFFYEI